MTDAALMALSRYHASNEAVSWDFPDPAVPAMNIRLTILPPPTLTVLVF